MLTKTHQSKSPWVIIDANDHYQAQLEAIKYVLDILPYK
jgi:polyphosphate kinase 2 (PPK2 family)